jgi:hypothetical protein
MKSEYFAEKTEKFLFEEICAYVSKYNATPTKEALNVILGSKETLSEDDFKEAYQMVD